MSTNLTKANALESAKRVRKHIAENPGITWTDLQAAMSDIDVTLALDVLERNGLVRVKKDEADTFCDRYWVVRMGRARAKKLQTKASS